MKLFGTIVYPKNRYLTLQFSKGGKNVTCDDCFDNMVSIFFVLLLFFSIVAYPYLIQELYICCYESNVQAHPVLSSIPDSFVAYNTLLWSLCVINCFFFFIREVPL